MRTRARGKTYLYRAFCSHGGLLYVGITSDYRRRLDDHAASSPWWSEAARVTVISYFSRTAALRAERYAIQNDHPVHNVTGRPLGPTSTEWAAVVATVMPGCTVVDLPAGA